MVGVTAPQTAPQTKKKRRRRYVRVEECWWHWNNATPVYWPDVHLPDDWHLNPQRIPVPPIPASGRSRAVEIARRRRLLPPDLYNDPAYAPASRNWDRWFAAEHDDRRRTYFAPAPTPPTGQLPEYPAPPPGQEPELWIEEDVVDDDDDP